MLSPENTEDTECPPCVCLYFYGLICCYSDANIGIIAEIREIIFGILPKSEKNIIEMNVSADW